VAAQLKSLPAPVGGWNARDSIADMPESDAVALENWFPTPTECQLRYGFTKYSTGLPSQVETIFSYAGGATDKLFGVSNGAIYDCTAGGAVGAAAVSGLTNSRFQYINNATAGGNYLLAVNGADKMRYFDGTTWSADGGTFTVTVADTSNWLSICLHKQRVWAIQKNTLIAWYLPPAAIAGAAVQFSLQPFFKRGGSLAAIETWTLDGGEGVDDYLVFVSTKGEVLIYRGTDPTTTATWQMVGLFDTGSPVGGARCLYKYQGDLLYLNQDGLLPLSKALLSERVEQRQAVSAKIESALSSAVSTYSTTFGWQMLNFPKQDMLILNVPVAVGSQQQYVMNTISGSWCNFTGWTANCWELYQNNAYFGGNTYIGKAWDSNADAGSNINSNALQAYSRFGSGNQKRFTMARPIFRSNGIPSVSASISIDYDQTDNTSPLSYAPTSAAGVWGTGVWGLATWGLGSLTVYKAWQGATGEGIAGAPRIKTASQGFDLRWVSTDVLYERGVGFL
jgi:hypothetical protein